MTIQTEPVALLPIQICPYVDWFKFRQCTIKTCKNFNEVTASKCLGIDRVVPIGNKVISDSELNLYKYRGKVSTRLVSMKRKAAIDRVKAMLILHKFIEFIRDQMKPDEVEYTGEEICKLETQYPLKVKRLGFNNWMWPHLLDRKLWKKFVHSHNGECADFSVAKLLHINVESYKRAVNNLTQET